MTPGLALAIERVEAEDPRRQTIHDDTMCFADLAEFYAERDKQQREAADPAA